MRAFWTALVVVMAAVAVGGCGGDKRGAEAAAKELIEAARLGDVDAILEHCDLKGVYEGLSEEYRQETPYDAFVRTRREILQEKFVPSPDLEYKDLAAKVDGRKATVTMAIRTSPTAEWAQHTMILTRIDGVWKVTIEGFAGLPGAPPAAE